MTKITIKVADFDKIYNAVDAVKIVKMTKSLAKTDQHPYWVLLAKVAAKIKYGAIKMEGWWYPVRNGVIDRKCGGYQHNTAAYGIAAYGQNVNSEVQHITSL